MFEEHADFSSNIKGMGLKYSKDIWGTNGQS